MFFPAPLAFVILVTQVALSRVHCDVATAQRSPKFKLGGQEAKFFLNFDSAAKDPQINMTTTEIIRHRGYDTETHNVMTDDGYILQLDRIPRRKGEVRDSRSRPVVFLQHGFLGSSSTWVISPSERSLPFLLADRGYDVWMGNYRGNTYSRRHAILSDKNAVFWDFSFDEIGQYDTPAMINYVLNATGVQSMSYVCYSMSCPILFIGLIKNPQLNAKMNSVIALAPTSSLGNGKGLLNRIRGIVLFIQSRIRTTQVNPVLANQGKDRATGELLCRGLLLQIGVCKNLLMQLNGPDQENFDQEFIQLMSAHFPAGTSVRSMEQLRQNYHSGEKFTAYNFGADANMVRYGQRMAPAYDLSQVAAPVHVFWSQNDYIADPKDVAWLVGQLGNLQSNNRLDKDNFNHIAYAWGKNAKQVLYDRIFLHLPNPHPSIDNSIR